MCTLAGVVACSAGQDPVGGGGSPPSTGGSGGQIFTVGGSSSTNGGAGPMCGPRCSLDAETVLDCEGEPTETCGTGLACDLTKAACVPACTAAESNRSSVGCEYFAVFMDSYVGEQACFVAIVANTSDLPAQIEVSYAGESIDLTRHRG